MTFSRNCNWLNRYLEAAATDDEGGDSRRSEPLTQVADCLSASRDGDARSRASLQIPKHSGRTINERAAGTLLRTCSRYCE
jgi:hypothetical protein